MRIALIGSAGQLGSDLLPLLPGEVIALRHHDIELGDDTSVPQVLDDIAPDIVINTAAYNLVDKAEDDPQAAWQDRKSTRLNSSHIPLSRMPSSA